MKDNRVLLINYQDPATLHLYTVPSIDRVGNTLAGCSSPTRTRRYGTSPWAQEREIFRTPHGREAVGGGSQPPVDTVKDSRYPLIRGRPRKAAPPPTC